jgi:addiction module HigA family antidote
MATRSTSTWSTITEGQAMAMHDPPHPGEHVLEDCIRPLGLSVGEAARRLGVAEAELQALVDGRAGVTPGMALRLARAFGASPTSWMLLQAQHDLWHAEQALRDELGRIPAA